MNKILLYLVAGALILSSCKRNPSLFNSTKDKLEISDPEFDYLSSKAKFKFEHDGKKIPATANFRIKKDSIIWVSISAVLGLEAARILITRDHVFVLDKLKKQYHEYEFSELSEQYGFDFDFNQIQSVILGNLSEPYRNERVEKTADHFMYEVQRGQYSINNYIGARSQKLERVEVLDDSTKNTILVNYSDFMMVDQEIFPKEISAIIQYESKGKPNTEISISYNKLVIEEIPLAFPFNVPSRYGRK